MANAHVNKAFVGDDGTTSKEGDINNGKAIYSTDQDTPIKEAIVIERQLYSQTHFDEENTPKQPSSKNICEDCSSILRKCTCSGGCVKKFIYKYLPIIRIMSMYNFKKDIVGDLAAGLTIGIMQIPQGMAYALLASVPAVYGLYTSFWPVLIYFFFGTSNHISMGTYAITSLMTGGIAEEECSHLAPPDLFLEGGSYNTNSTVIDPWDACKIGVACSLALLAGLFMLILGVLNLGWLTIYLSTPLTRGFTTASAIHVFTSQVKHIFGVKLSRYSGPLNIVYTYIEFFDELNTANNVTILISIVTCLVLALTKEFFSPWFKKKLKLPFPIDLIIVIAVTVISYLGKFHDKYEVDIVDDIPTGIPAPAVPQDVFENFFDILPSVISIAIVGYANSMSLAKLFAQKHGYQVDANQELLAHGLANTGGSFLNCFHSAPSMSRTLVYEGSGAVTQLTGAISCVLILLVLLVLGPLFSDLPKCILASIIIVALKGMFVQFFDVKELWKVDKIDLSIWIVTFLATLFLDVDYGLIVGVAFSLLTVIYRTQRPRTAVLGQVPQTDIYKSVKVYDAAQECPGIKIFRFESGLYYANHENFVDKLFKKTHVNPRTLLVQKKKLDKKKKDYDAKLKKQQAKQDKLHSNQNNGSVRARQVTKEHTVRFELPELPLHTIILDCSMMAFIDSVGVTALTGIIKAYDKVGIKVYLASCKGALRRTLDQAGFYKSHDREIMFVTVHDAVINATPPQEHQQEASPDEVWTASNTYL